MAENQNLVDSKKLGIVPWYSIQSTEPKKSMEFYNNLLSLDGSEIEMPGMGKHFFLKKNKTVFADIEKVKEGESSHWQTWFSVEDIDNFVSKASRLGAVVVSKPFDIPSIGRGAVLQDPCGGVFSAYTPFDWRKTTSAMGNEEGMICWNELMVGNPQKALAFYGECMGWRFTKSTDMGDLEYYTIKTMDDQQIGGILKNPPAAKDMAPMWMPYMMTSDIKSATEKSKKLGAKVLKQISEIPKTGFFSLLQDPTGCQTYLFMMSPKH